VAFLEVPQSKHHPTPGACSAFDRVERAKALDSHHVIANSVAVDDSDAGACARGKRIQSRQCLWGRMWGLKSH